MGTPDLHKNADSPVSTLIVHGGRDAVTHRREAHALRQLVDELLGEGRQRIRLRRDVFAELEVEFDDETTWPECPIDLVDA